MRQDILKIIRNSKDITNAIILTHNIDFVFVQSVVIPALRKCGSPSLTIFADAECATQTYQHQARVLGTLGQRYRVVPVAMKPGYRFHPKAVLLSGPRSATLLVGSGNLTFGGWRENGEVWSRYDSDNDGTQVLAAFREYLRQVLEICPESDALTPEVEEAFDPNTRRWAASMEDPGVLLGRCGQGQAMLDQIAAVVGDAAVDELHVCAPYFDLGAEALKRLAEQLGSPPTRVLVQSHRTNLPTAAAQTLDESFTLRAATYRHREGMGDGERVREALLHAKFYAVRQANTVTVFSGSADCSHAALTVPGSAGNAELMTYATMSSLEFEEEFLAELAISDAEPVLAAVAEDEEPPPATAGFLHILAARMEAGLLRVAFRSDETTRLTHAEIDQAAQRIEPIGVESHRAIFQARGNPRMLVLVGTSQDAVVRSQLHWIDNESALRSSARGRSLAESIHTRVRSDLWGIGAYRHVLSELLGHLQYMPKVGSHRRSDADGDRKTTGDPVEFEWDDVFSDTYGLRTGLSPTPDLTVGPDDRVDSLRSLLLRWYGIGRAGQDEPTPTSDDDPVQPEVMATEGEGVDTVAEVPTVVPKPKMPTASDREKKAALKVVHQIAARLGEPEFLSERHPEHLAVDLKVAAALLRVGMASGWLTEQEFFKTTLAIWLPLFFNAAGSEDTGWLVQRYRTAPHPEEFARSIRSSELAAALACWALSTPAKVTSEEHALFALASAIGVAQLPWLWQTGGNRSVAKEMQELLALTSRVDDLDMPTVDHRWRTLIRRGCALSQLERAIAAAGFVELCGRIKQRKVVAGELLWQRWKGGAGYCVATEDCERVRGERATVRVLQQADGGTRRYLGSFLMPVAGLLDERVLGDTVIQPRARSELRKWIGELRAGLRHGESDV